VPASLSESSTDPSAAIAGPLRDRRSVDASGDSIQHTLEVIDKGSCSEAHPTPLLFIHGAWHAAWCWDEHFLHFFAERGYRALALSLRGHGKSPAPKPLRICSLADYIDDVESVAKSLPTRPALIGHSMGGFLVQKYLESGEAPAGVLIASAPQRGSLGFTMRLTRRHPWLITKGLITGDVLLAVGTPELARESLFSARTLESEVVRYVARLNGESQRVALDTMLFLPRPKRVTTPLLVLGAELDRSILPKEVHATARAYRTEAEIFPEMGHDMMLEPGWEAVASRIHFWLDSRGP
jgi:pimeloyl-ACP methyl ester carboxylesterase